VKGRCLLRFKFGNTSNTNNTEKVEHSVCGIFSDLSNKVESPSF